MSRVFWDTNLFVYLVEDRGERAERVSTLRRRMIEWYAERGEFRIEARFGISAGAWRCRNRTNGATGT